MDFGNRKAVSPAELQAVLADLAQAPTQGITVHDFDHVVSASSTKIDTAPPVTAVLYGALGTEAFWSLHQALVEAAGVDSGTSGDELLLQGPRRLCNAEVLAVCQCIDTCNSAHLPHKLSRAVMQQSVPSTS